MKFSKLQNYRPVVNCAVVAEEKSGFAHQLITRHKGSASRNFRDRAVAERVRNMSVVEVIA